MGLDQYIYLRDPRYQDSPIEAAYFRKVNFLHRYIEQVHNNGESTNCDEIPLTLDDLKRLQSRLLTVKASPYMGEQMLPTESRFFFGRTDYDEGYLEDVKSVLAKITEIIDDHDDGDEYFYYSWW